MYMSVSLLTFLAHGWKLGDGSSVHPKHDRLDDIESFYYVLFDIMHTRHGNGQGPVEDVDPDIARVLAVFGENDPTASMNAKRSHFMTKVMDVTYIPDTWLGPSVELLRALFREVKHLVVEKGGLAKIDSDEQVDELDGVIKSVEETYDNILAHIDKAIADLEGMEEVERDESEDSGEDSDDDTGDDGDSNVDYGVANALVLGTLEEEDSDTDTRDAQSLPSAGPSTNLPRSSGAPLPELCFSPISQNKRPRSKNLSIVSVPGEATPHRGNMTLLLNLMKYGPFDSHETQETYCIY